MRGVADEGALPGGRGGDAIEHQVQRLGQSVDLVLGVGHRQPLVGQPGRGDLLGAVAQRGDRAQRLPDHPVRQQRHHEDGQRPTDQRGEPHDVQRLVDAGGIGRDQHGGRAGRDPDHPQRIVGIGAEAVDLDPGAAAQRMQLRRRHQRHREVTAGRGVDHLVVGVDHLHLHHAAAGREDRVRQPVRIHQRGDVVTGLDRAGVERAGERDRHDQHGQHGAENHRDREQAGGDQGDPPAQAERAPPAWPQAGQLATGDVPVARHEPVPSTPNRLDGRTVERHVDLAPQVPDVHLDHVRVAVVVRIPHVMQDLTLGHRLPGTTHQIFEQCELARRQLDDGLAPGHRVRGRIEHQVTDREDGRAGSGPAAQQGAQPGEQHDERERLGHVVVGAQIQRVGLVVLAVLGGEHQDRHPVLGFAQRLDDAVARQARQHDVQDHRVVVTLRGRVQPVRTGVGEIDGEAFGAEAALQGRREPKLVFDNEQPHASRVPLGPGPCLSKAQGAHSAPTACSSM